MELSYLKRRGAGGFATYKLRKRCEAVYDRLRLYCPGNEAPAVLDIGACDGRMLSYLKDRLPEARCEGVEPDPRFLARVSDPRVRVRAGRAEDLDFPDGTLDFVVMSSVLEHVEGEAAGLAEARRVLKPGGALCVIAVLPLYEKLTVLTGFKKSDHFRNYSLPELKAALERAGFAAVEASPMPFPLFYNIAVGRK